MAKDYAKNNRKKKKSGASRSKKKSSISKPLLVVTLLLISGLAFLLVYLKWFQVQSKPQKTQRSNQQVDQQTAINPKKIKTMKAKNDRNDSSGKNITENPVPFYRTHKEILDKTVEIPLEDLKLPDDENKYVYSMPCGSFRDDQRAEELKAKIALVGFESNITQVNVESGLWHRVELGPFKSKRRTESIRHRLQDNGFENCVIWRKRVK